MCITPLPHKPRRRQRFCTITYARITNRRRAPNCPGPTYQRSTPGEWQDQNTHVGLAEGLRRQNDSSSANTAMTATTKAPFLEQDTRRTDCGGKLRTALARAQTRIVPSAENPLKAYSESTQRSSRRRFRSAKFGCVMPDQGRGAAGAGRRRLRE